MSSAMSPISGAAKAIPARAPKISMPRFSASCILTISLWVKISTAKGQAAMGRLKAVGLELGNEFFGYGTMNSRW